MTRAAQASFRFEDTPPGVVAVPHMQAAPPGQDVVLLSALLSRAAPERDTSSLAQRLLARHGSLAAVLAAPRLALLTQPGVTERMVRELRLAQDIATHTALAACTAAPVIENPDAVRRYASTRLAGQAREGLLCLFLSTKLAVLHDEIMAWGTVDHVPVYPREIARRALEVGASAVILAHNHPSGDPTPSRADIAMTRRVAAALATLQMTLHDHLIIGRGPPVSLRSLGHLTSDELMLKRETAHPKMRRSRSVA